MTKTLAELANEALPMPSAVIAALVDSCRILPWWAKWATWPRLRWPHAPRAIRLDRWARRRWGMPLVEGVKWTPSSRPTGHRSTIHIARSKP